MVPPKSETHRTSYIEQCGPGVRDLRCEICNNQCSGGRIIEHRYMDENFVRNTKFSTLCTRCKTKVVCYECWEDKLCCEKKEKAEKKSRSSSSLDCNTFCIIFGVLFISMSFYYLFLKSPSGIGKNYQDLETIIKDEYYNLRNKFPDQKQELWGNVLHVMHNFDSVTTLTFLYKDDPKTSDCLAEEIAFSYSRIQNRTFNRESIFTADNEIDDFGIVLEEYGLKVEKTNLLIVKHLHKISGNVARVFHTLCDNVTPKVAPSVYIFTLRYDDRVEKVKKPIAKASTVLREAWKDLPEKELHALISRIVTNVVEVKSVNTKNC